MGQIHPLLDDSIHLSDYYYYIRDTILIECLPWLLYLFACDQLFILHLVHNYHR